MEVEGEQLATKNGRSARLRCVYETISLAMIAHKEGALFPWWSLGERALPAVTGFESPMFGSIFAPDGPHYTAYPSLSSRCLRHRSSRALISASAPFSFGS